MKKKILFLFVGLMAFQTVRAQKDTLLYYIKKSGELVSNKDSADYYLFFLPADSASGKKLYPVKEFYTNWKPRLTGYTHERLYADLDLDSACTIFYPSGTPKQVINFKDKEPFGKMIEYYPNGQLYTLEDVVNGETHLIECCDSSGTKLTNNGNGHWITYNDNFTSITDEGEVKDSLETGEWHGSVTDTGKYTCNYNDGRITTGTSNFNSGKKYSFRQFFLPSYFYGVESFHSFIVQHAKYPKYEKKNRIGGYVVISLVIEKDGSLTHVKVIEGPTQDLNTALLNAVKLSSPWKPALLCGMPVSNATIVLFKCDPDLSEFF
jgi:TonB family protein